MNLLQTVQDLIRFRTETGNLAEIDKCMTYCQELFKNSTAYVDVCRYEGTSPVLFIRNQKTEDFDVVVLGHLDVVPASDEMFSPYIKDGKMFGRGTLDMKSFAAVAFNSMFHVLQNK